LSAGLSFSVRADLFRVARAFAHGSDSPLCGVRVEPQRVGPGVVMIGWNGADLIAIADPSGAIARSATLKISTAVLTRAVDMFRNAGCGVRLVGEGGVAFIPGDSAGHASRDYEIRERYGDWRRALAPHAVRVLQPPFVFGARQARKLADAAIGLARAAEADGGQPFEAYELKGSVGGVLATFPDWPDAVALFALETTVETLRAENPCTMWRPPHWAHAIGPALVENGAA
jgi:hypothetical protein